MYLCMLACLHVCMYVCICMCCMPWLISKVLTWDALRMRLTRLCQKRKGGACHVDEQTHKEWQAGGERKEWLELALVEVLKEVGTADAGPAAFKRVKDYGLPNVSL